VGKIFPTGNIAEIYKPQSKQIVKLISPKDAENISENSIMSRNTRTSLKHGRSPSSARIRSGLNYRAKLLELDVPGKEEK
jgi:hypothetical protein